MRKQNQEEYKQTRAEIIRTQDCITDYLKAFFVLGGSVISVALIISRLGIAIPELSNFIYPSFGFIIIAFSFIVMSFGSIMFHKFITHNRYTGYAQAISFEDGQESDEKKLSGNAYFWEYCMFTIHNNIIIVGDSAEDNEKNAVSYLQMCENSCRFTLPTFCGIAHYRDIWRFLKRSVAGAYMVFRAPFNKVPTQSWTYPYFVAFGTFVILASLIASLIAIIVVSMSSETHVSEVGHLIRVEYQVAVQILFAAYIIVCWAGMFNRLYRVCAVDGDRTVLYFFYRFALSRQRALDRYGIDYDWSAVPPAPSVQ